METPCRQPRSLRQARTKSMVLLAAISVLAFLSVPCTVAFSATTAAPPASRPLIFFYPINLSFASRSVGTTSAAQTISVRDLGRGILEITSVAITGTNAGDFFQTNNCSSLVGLGRSCTISVTFRPTASGSRSASLSITDNASGSPQTISLSGTATGSASSPSGSGTATSPAVSLSPTSLNFASQAVSTTSADQAVTLSNTGSGGLSITSLAITGTNASDFAQTNTCGSTVAASGACRITVSFTPSGTGSRSASISITDNASGSPQRVALSGTGIAASGLPTPTFSIPPGTYTSAQTVTISDTVPATTIYYTTNGTAPTTASTRYTSAITVSSTETIEAIATASGYSISAVASATYTITSPAATPSFSLASGTYTSIQTVTISDATAGATIYYTTNGATPTTSSTQYTSALTVSSTETIEAIATASGYSTSAVATATYTISLPAASLSPTSLAFGSQPIDVTSAAQTVTLSNTGNTAQSISTPTLTGVNASDFAETSTCSSSLAAGASCTIEVTFTPSVPAAEAATLSITDNASASPPTVNLTGTGSPDVIVSWGSSPTSGVVGYNVFRGTTSGGESTTPLNSTPINGTSYVDTNVTPEVTYYYYVTAVGSDGVQSAPSGETKATVP